MISVEADLTNPPPLGWPVPIIVTLTCDANPCPHRTSRAFTHDDDFIGAYRKAIQSGWKDTFRKGERVFL